MAKKQTEPADKLATFATSLTARIGAQRKALEKKFGVDIRPMPTVGLYLPHLALRYVFRGNVLLFGRSYVVFGPPGSCKSSLLYWLYRLFVQAGGYYMHLEAEDKDQPALRASVLGYPAHIDDDQWRHRVATLNDYQKLYYSYCEWFRDQCGKLGVGRRVPFIVGIDSLTAKLAENTLDAFTDNDGATTQRFGDAANAIAQWMRWATNTIHGWPFLLVGVNHDKAKPGKSQYDAKTHHAPGGDHPLFAATTRILVERSRQLPRLANGDEGVTVRMKVDKNSASVTGQQIEVDFKWNATEPQQRSWWDFDKASIVLLESLIENAKGQLSENLQDLLQLQKHAGGLWSSKALDVAKSDAVTAAELGARLEMSPLLPDVERLLEIRQGLIFSPGDDMETYMQKTAGYTDE